MQLQDNPISRWSGTPIYQPTAAEPSRIQFGSFLPGEVDSLAHKSSQATASPTPYYVVTPMCQSAAAHQSQHSKLPTSPRPDHSSQGAATMGPQGPYFVVTPMCKKTTAQSPEHSCLDSASSDSASLTSAGTPPPSLCRGPSALETDSDSPREDARPSSPPSSTPELQQCSQRQEEEVRPTSVPRIGSMSSLL